MDKSKLQFTENMPQVHLSQQMMTQNYLEQALWD
jgi:hypothetical protein